MGPIARSRAEDAGRRRGLRGEIGSVRPGIMSVTLKDGRFPAEEKEGAAAPWLSGQLDRVEVRFGLGLGLRAIQIRGGHVNLAGSPDEVSQHVRDLRKGSAQT